MSAREFCSHCKKCSVTFECDLIKERPDCFFEFLGDILHERNKLPKYEIPVELEFVPLRFKS